MYIHLSEIQKKYLKGTPAEVYALKNVNLSINRGERVAIVGPSGSGKSTLLHVLGLLDKPTKGQYILEGNDISNLNQKELALLRNKKIGFVLQEFGLIHNQTVIENVSIPLFFSQMPYSKIRKVAEEIIERIQITHLAKKKINELSGGQKQRVAIARAIVNNPDLILADEPTGSLDSKTADEVMELLWSYHEMGKTIIVITHHPKLAEECERTIEIKDGIIC